MKKINYLLAMASVVFAFAACTKEDPKVPEGPEVPETPAIDATVEFVSPYIWHASELGNTVTVPVSVSGTNIAYPLGIKFEAVSGEYSVAGTDYEFVSDTVTVAAEGESADLVLNILAADPNSFKAAFAIKTVDNGAVIGDVDTVFVFSSAGLQRINGLYDVKGTFVSLEGEENAEYTEQWYFNFMDFGFMQMTTATGLCGLSNTQNTEQNERIVAINGNVCTYAEGITHMDFVCNTDVTYYTKDDYKYKVRPIITDRNGNVIVNPSISFVYDGVYMTITAEGADDTYYFGYGLFDDNNEYAGVDYHGYLALKDLKAVPAE